MGCPISYFGIQRGVHKRPPCTISPAFDKDCNNTAAAAYYSKSHEIQVRTNLREWLCLQLAGEKDVQMWVNMNLFINVTFRCAALYCNLTLATVDK